MTHMVSSTCTKDVPFLDDCEGGVCTWCELHQNRTFCPKHARAAGWGDGDPVEISFSAPDRSDTGGCED